MHQASADERRTVRATSTATWPKLTADAYQGPMAKLGGGPETVAETIAGALGASAPRRATRSPPSAHLMISQRRVTPDRVWDLMMRAQFPTPKR